MPNLNVLERIARLTSSEEAADIGKFCEKYEVRLTRVSTEGDIPGTLMYYFTGDEMRGGYSIHGIRESLKEQVEDK
ncbi:MAG: hypothetical protein PHF67_04345 [Candidatus Nanoarchaeia archaeon]|nr:hypothetical protein [Candidatus Nanoarchaeia archaeon]